MYLVYIIMSEYLAAMKRKSEAITAARAEADVIGGTDTDKADTHFKKLCTAINRDFKKVLLGDTRRPFPAQKWVLVRPY